MGLNLGWISDNSDIFLKKEISLALLTSSFTIPTILTQNEN